MTISIGNGLVKATGAVGLGTILYDAHKLGKIQAETQRKNAMANFALDTYVDTTQLSRPSSVLSNIQQIKYNLQTRHPLINTVVQKAGSISGYFQGAATSLVENAVPFALTAATLLSKGSVSKVGAAGLLACGIHSLATDVFSVGRNKWINK